MRVYITISAAALVAFAVIGLAEQAGPYKVLKTAKVGGAGAFDYVYADANGRKLYIPRPGNPNPRITVFNPDTLEPAGEIPGANARGVAVSTKSGHAFGVWVFSHGMPHATAINAADGTIAGTLDPGGAPEQAATDGKGHIYVDIEDMADIAVVDAKARRIST